MDVPGGSEKTRGEIKGKRQMKEKLKEKQVMTLVNESTDKNCTPNLHSLYIF